MRKTRWNDTICRLTAVSAQITFEPVITLPGHVRRMTVLALAEFADWMRETRRDGTIFSGITGFARWSQARAIPHLSWYRFTIRHQTLALEAEWF